MSKTGLEGFNDEPEIPKRVLTQGMTRIKGYDDIRPGVYVDATNRVEIGKAMDVIVLDAKSSRKLFHPKGSSLKGLRCWSDDGIFPSAAVERPLSPQCRGCQHEKQDKVAELTCLDVKETQANGAPSVFAIEFKKTATIPVGTYLGAIRRRGKAARDFQATLAISKQSNDKGDWFWPDFTNVKPTPADLVAIANDEFARIDAVNDVDPTDLNAPIDAPPLDEEIPF